jgi:hypothetical protein
LLAKKLAQFVRGEGRWDGVSSRALRPGRVDCGERLLREALRQPGARFLRMIVERAKAAAINHFARFVDDVNAFRPAAVVRSAALFIGSMAMGIG